jgi:hypothetical protein
VVRRLLSVWSGPWPLVRQLLVLVVAEIYAIIACSAPAQAFQVSSATGYARVVSQAAQQAYIASHRAQVISAIAPAISAAGAGSVAIRAVAGPIGWASIAVSAGLVIAGMLYTNQEIQQVQNNAATFYGVPSVVAVNGQPVAAGGLILPDNCTGFWTIGCTQRLLVPNGLPVASCTGTSPSPPSGWEPQARGWLQIVGSPVSSCYDVYLFTYTGANQAQAATSTPGTPTTNQIAGYMGQLPASDPLAPEQQNQPAGTTNPAPTGSTSTTNIPVSPTEMPTTVVPANNVPAGSSVVDPNAPAPTQQTQTTQQSSTTTTTTNPDGSQTDQTTASVSCASGQHSSRTFGSVLQDHYDVWSASGLLGTLELLKNLSWPTTFPTYTLQSSVMGTFTFDFNAWSGVINALRALVIAGAGFVAYRIIFVGGH